jgi:hypothetical protein
VAHKRRRSAGFQQRREHVPQRDAREILRQVRPAQRVQALGVAGVRKVWMQTQRNKQRRVPRRCVSM